MSEPPVNLTIIKHVPVSVEVEVTISDVVRKASNDVIRAECTRRGIPIKAPKSGGRKHKIESVEIDAMLSAFQRRDWREFLWTLEWALPRDFRGLTDFLGAKIN